MRDQKAAFARRLKMAMEAKGWAPEPAVLERKFNAKYWGKPITLHGVRRWLLGETLPRHDKVAALALLLGVDAQALLFGAATPDFAVAERPARWDDDIGWSERELFLAFMRLPVPQRRIVREVIRAFALSNTTVRPEA